MSDLHPLVQRHGTVTDRMGASVCSRQELSDWLREVESEDGALAVIGPDAPTMTDPLRIYEPRECDGVFGVPLDWEECRGCEGTGTHLRHVQPGTVGVPTNRFPCPDCGGHGSLKAAVLALKSRDLILTKYDDPKRNTLHFQQRQPVRCESCGHPMSEGTFDPPRDTGYTMTSAERLLTHGEEPQSLAVHYSPCDEGCRHGGPGRYTFLVTGEGATPTDDLAAAPQGGGMSIEASWRPVDVRVLNDRPFDLRPDNLALLCLRCWAERKP